MSNETGEYIEVLYNTCYGGYCISDKAIALYNERKLARDPTHTPVKYDFSIDRDDPIIVEIYHELGSAELSGTYAKIKTAKLPEKYKKFWSVSEYDGKESIQINFNTYLLTLLILKICNAFQALPFSVLKVYPHRTYSLLNVSRRRTVLLRIEVKRNT